MTATVDSHAYAELVKPDTNNATYIGWTDWDEESDWLTDHYPPNKKNYYEHLDRMNQGLNNGYRTNRPYQTYRMNRDLAACLSSQLGMTASQRSRTIQRFTQLDLQRMGFPAQVVAFCVCAYVVHTDEEGRKCHPACKPEDTLFARLREQLSIPANRFAKVYGKVEHQIQNEPLKPGDFDRYRTDNVF